MTSLASDTMDDLRSLCFSPSATGKRSIAAAALRRSGFGPPSFWAPLTSRHGNGIAACRARPGPHKARLVGCGHHIAAEH